MSTSDSESESSLFDIGEPTANTRISPRTDPQRSLQVVKYIIDFYMDQSYDALVKRYLHKRLPEDVSAEVWCAAVRYANERSQAIEVEVRQLKARVVEIEARIRSAPVVRHGAPDLNPSDRWINITNEADLKQMVIDLILERAGKVEEMKNLTELVIKHARLSSGVRILSACMEHCTASRTE